MPNAYRGRHIEIHTERVGHKWTWWYLVDGIDYRKNSEELAPSEDIAMSEGLEHARKFIDAGQK